MDRTSIVHGNTCAGRRGGWVHKVPPHDMDPATDVGACVSMMVQSVLLHRSALLVIDFSEMLFNTSTVKSLVTNPRSESLEKGE
ncbi:hypothetical protein RvY_12527 [Ramazzottius varieornatus]|uniref:Uncharacterized protein n=1 Tax=Ramazzottius varieornatus TaxID=947166 RepID=A0A1D1VQ95_RAMVA|nr:hypothetical protein RvY_12527 [Ramazzottius varieornatus]